MLEQRAVHQRRQLNHRSLRGAVAHQARRPAIAAVPHHFQNHARD